MGRHKNPPRRRTLKRGESIPITVPHRSRSQHGYIELWWRISKDEIVRVYEHRVKDGVVVDSDDVHHLNGVKDDNRPDNLEPISRREHRRRHIRWNIEEATRLYYTGWPIELLAERYGINHGSMSRTLRTYGVKMRPARGSSKIRRAFAKRIRRIMDQPPSPEREAMLLSSTKSPFYGIGHVMELVDNPEFAHALKTALEAI